MPEARFGMTQRAITVFSKSASHDAAGPRDVLAASVKPPIRAPRRPIMCTRKISARSQFARKDAPTRQWSSKPSRCRGARAASESPAPTMCRPSIECGALLHEMFMTQIRRFAREVLPALQAHRVASWLVEEVPA